MTEHKPVKRFIAGAICPHCGQMDKVRLWREADTEHTDCVHCGATEVFNQEPTAQPTSPPTLAQKVRIIQPM